MNLCYIYYETSSYPYSKELLKAFNNFDFIDMSKVNTLKIFDIYVIELQHINKQTVSKTKELFESHTNSLIYFIIPDEYKLSFFQLAFLLNAKSMISNKQEINLIIKQMKKDLYDYKENFRVKELGKYLVNHSKYMLFENKKLSYVSDNLMGKFGCKTLKAFENQVCSKINLNTLLNRKNGFVKHTIDYLDDNKVYFSNIISMENRHYFSLDERDVSKELCNDLPFLSTRLTFVEMLKDKLIKKMISSDKYLLLTLQVSNTDDETFMKDFLHEVDMILDQKHILSHYNTNFYVLLFENIEFDDLMVMAKNFKLQITSFINKQQFNTKLLLHVFDIDNVAFDTVISTLNKLSRNELPREEVVKKKIIHIDSFDENMSNNEVVSYLLDSAFVNDSSLELMNLYKGMTINTSSKILKKDATGIYITFKQVQGAIMSVTRTVVLKSPLFKKDIKANVKYINLREKIAILDNFVVLDYDMNSRQHGRVTFAKKNRAALALMGTKLLADIVDISVYSICLKVKYAKFLDTIVGKRIDISFHLPDSCSINGTTEVTETANVLYSKCDSNAYCKIVCLFDEQKENEDTLMSFVYKRQVDIINEMKNMVS